MMKKATESDEGELITLTEASEIRGYKDVSAISQLVRRGRLRSTERYGKTLVYRSEVLAFEPQSGGRPPKAGKVLQVEVASKTKMKGRKK
jgi:hypothetical protein